MGRAHFDKMAVFGSAAVASALVIGGIAAGVSTSHRELQIEADGTSMVLSGYYPTVYSAVKAAGVDLGVHDQVIPATSERTHNGDVIVVNRAQSYTLSSDKKQETRWSRARTLAAVLDDLRPQDQSIAVSRGKERAELPVADKDTAVELNVDGKTQPAEVAPGQTVEEVLHQAGIELSPLDSVRVKRDGAKIVIGVETERRGVETTTEEIPFSQERVDDPDLAEGTEVVSQEGVAGERTIRRYRQVRAGKEIVSVELSRNEVRPAQNEIVKVGTKKAPAAPAASSSGSSGPVLVGDAAWDALAQCESSGNPQAVNPAGYYGLFQFDLGTWASVGGTGLPSDASPAEQLERAKILYSQRGWQPWGCASIVGLR